MFTLFVLFLGIFIGAMLSRLLKRAALPFARFAMWAASEGKAKVVEAEAIVRDADEKAAAKAAAKAAEGKED